MKQVPEVTTTVDVRPRIATILSELERATDGIYSGRMTTAVAQADEIRLREAVAERSGGHLLEQVGRHHSIPVMDAEVRWFLARIPRHGVIVDVGGGWGWHWRHLGVERPDVGVVLVDFVRANLAVAARLLGSVVDARVFLVHAEATTLPFPPSSFDGYWSVQALQHIPGLQAALTEADRVLKPGGEFAAYWLNRAPMVEAAYRLMRRRYHRQGRIAGSFYLARASADMAATVARVFGSPVVSRYTEILFHPDLRAYTGSARSRIGALDARLSGSMPLLSWVARQRSYHTRKQS